MNLAHLLRRQALMAGDRPAIFTGTTPWATYSQWAQRSAGLAQRFRSSGLQAGDRVLLFMRNHPRYLEVLWAAWWAGLVAVPVNAKLHPAEVAFCVETHPGASGDRRSRSPCPARENRVPHGEAL